MKVGEVQQEIVDLIQELPVVTGVGIKGDVMVIQNTFSDLTGENVKMRGFVDLSALAVLAGWKLRARNMTAMAVIGLGSIMNKISSIADSLWGLPFNKLPKEFQVYAVGDVKVGHLLYVTLFMAIVLETFPDPDSACYVTGVTQEIFLQYYAEWICSALKDKVIYEEQIKDADNRQQLLKAIRYQTRNGKVSVDESEKVKVFARQVLRGYPTVSYGGPRFIHIVRYNLPEQYYALKDSQIRFPRDLFLKDISTLDNIYLRFGHEDIDRCDARAPIDAADYKEVLVHHPDLREKRFVIDWHNVRIQDLLDQSMWKERAQKSSEGRCI